MSGIRKASEVNIGFPYDSKLVCFFEVYPNNTLSQLHTKSEKREAYENAKAGKSKIYAVWPGQWTSDLFEIDNLEDYITNI